MLALLATNVDDIVVLFLLCAAGAGARAIVLGQYVGFLVIVLAAAALSLSVRLVPAAWVGFLGMVPFSISVRDFLRLWRIKANGPPKLKGIGLGAVASITIANGCRSQFPARLCHTFLSGMT